MVERFSFEKFPSEKKMEVVCEGCGQVGHSFEECPYISEEEKEKIRKKIMAKRLVMEKNIEKDITSIRREKDMPKNTEDKLKEKEE